MGRHCLLGEEEKEEEDGQQQLSKFKNLGTLNPKLLDDVAHDFQLNYRAKLDLIKSELKHGI